MLKAEQIQGLIQKNQSVDAEKTKERVKEIWTSLEKKIRDEILKLCGLTQFAIRKTYVNGYITPKVVCAISQTLKINPYYLIGESDEKDYFTDEIISDFLKNRNITVAKTSGKAKAAKSEKSAEADKTTEAKKPAKAEQTKTVKPAKTVSPAKSAKAKTVTETKDATGKAAAVLSAASLSPEAPAITAAPSHDAPPKAKTQTAPSGSFERDALNELSRLSGELFSSLPNAKRDKIDKMTEDELLVLLNGLVMRTRISGDSGNMLKLVKYILSC